MQKIHAQNLLDLALDGRRSLIITVPNVIRMMVPESIVKQNVVSTTEPKITFENSRCLFCFCEKVSTRSRL